MRASTPFARKARKVSKPEMPFIFKSRIIKSGSVAKANATPSVPLLASPTTSILSSKDKIWRMPWRING